MKIYKYLEKNLIFLDKDFKSKEEISSEIIDMIYKIDSRTDKELLLKDIIDREKIASTSFGKDIGIFHAKSSGVNRVFLAFYRLKEPYLFPKDENKTKLIFFIGIPSDKKDEHLEILAEFSRNVLDENFLKSLMGEDDKDKIIELFKNREMDFRDVEENKKGGYALALLSCPSGMIYNFIAEEVLKKLASEKSVGLEVYLRKDFQNITRETIENADFVIVANKSLSSYPRLCGKKVIFGKIEDLIKNPEKYLFPEGLSIYKEDKTSLMDAFKIFRRKK